MNLEQYRKSIDEIDTELISLFEKRMDVVSKIADFKKENNLPTLDRKREAEKLDEIANKVRDDLEPYAHTLFDTLFELSRVHQSDLRRSPTALSEEVKEAISNTENLFPPTATVACQGVEGAYSQLACLRLFAKPGIQYFKTFDSVFSAIENGFCRYGVLPLENSVAGSVNNIYTLMQTRNFKIVRSVRMKIDHCLLTLPDVKLEDIKEVVSHEQAIAQCSVFLDRLGPDVKITRCENTATAAEMVANSGRRDIAAISSQRCIELYGLSCLARDIQDSANNYTRFICISKSLEIYPGADRTSIMMAVAHRSGSLYKVLARFYALGINLTKLESRPIPNRDSEFMFYFDIETSVYSEEFARLLESIQDICAAEFKYLGSYSEIT